MIKLSSEKHLWRSRILYKLHCEGNSFINFITDLIYQIHFLQTIEREIVPNKTQSSIL